MQTPPPETLTSPAPRAGSPDTGLSSHRRLPRMSRGWLDYRPTGAALPFTRPEIIAHTVIMALVVLTRWIALSFPDDHGTPIFDEKHYVPQAWNMVTSSMGWITGGLELNPGYGLVVHPPLSKQLMAFSQALFGYTPFGWRAASALAGCILVWVIVLITRRITGSRVAGVAAGIIGLCDGVLLITSRFGMLDIFLMLAVAVATYCLVRDRADVTERFRQARLNNLDFTSLPLGPRMGVRWWRLLAGLALGCALAVKWSGLYYMAFFGIYLVVADCALRYREQVKKPVFSTFLYDAWASFVAVVIVPIGVYLFTFRAWFASETSVYRHQKNAGELDEHPLIKWMPESLASFVDYHRQVLTFHGSVTSSSGHHHPWDSKPLSWLIGARPVLYYSETNIDCPQGTCRAMIYLFGTPAIWWLTVPAIVWALYCVLRRADVRYTVPLLGWAASYIPWLLVYDRQMYFFYAGPLVMFTIIILATITADVLRAHNPEKPGPIKKYPHATWPRIAGIGYLALVVWMFIFFTPILYGITIPEWYYRAMMWLPTWT